MDGHKFDELKNCLLGNEGHGYTMYDQHWKHEDYVIAKGFHKEDNKWEENRCGYQILLSVYDYRGKEYAKNDPLFHNRVGIEITIDVSRTIDERMELTTCWDENTTIEEVESMAESFYRWVCQKEPPSVC